MQATKAQQIIRDGRKLLWPTPGDGYFAWVKDNWTSRGEPLDFDEHKYLVELYRDQSPFIAMMKSAQTGATERGLSEAMWLADQYNENAIYAMPTSGAVADMVKERIDPVLDGRKYMREAAGREGFKIGKSIDGVGLKRMHKGFVYFRGANKPTQITSIPGDAVFIDEVDRMIPENLPYFPKRLNHSKRRWERWFSTPTIPNYGIHKIFLTTDQRYFYIKCTHCNAWQSLTFEENVEFKMKNDLECQEAMLVCSHCRMQVVPWLCDSEWRPHNPGTDKHGYFITKLYSPRLDLANMVESSLKTSEWEIQQFRNQDLGVPYEPKGGRITEELLNSCRRGYKNGTVTREGNNFMGVDVGSKLHVIIQNSAGKVVFITTVKEFEELDKLMDEYNIKTAVVDALPETREVQKFCLRFPGRAFMCYYTGLKEPKEGEWFQHEDGTQKINTDRTIALDMYSARFKNQSIELPIELESMLEFKLHMQALTRVITVNRKGEQRAEYLQTGPDHYYHAGNYSNLAKGLFERTPEPEIFIL